MTTAHFKNLPTVICNHLTQAKHRVRIAVCWFTHRELYSALLGCAQRGVRIDLMIEYDTRNICPDGLDFNALIRAGVVLYACRNAALMHHKFALIDEHTLLTGSFNWTYSTNAENLLVCKEPDLCRVFNLEFETLKAGAERIFHTRPQDAKPFAGFPLFENTLFQLSELRKRIGQGARVWRIDLDLLYQKPEAVLQQAILPFDTGGLLTTYWSQQRFWDRDTAQAYLSTLSGRHSPAQLRTLRCWALRMRTGDLIFATVRRHQLAAIGLIQSGPERYEGPRFSSARAAQWQQMPEPHCLLEKKAITGGICAFRGSALAVLAVVKQ